MLERRQLLDRSAGFARTAASVSSTVGPWPIERHSPGATALVGRALKGPLNTPLRVHSFAEFQQHFGGLWQPSMLSYAVEQYFDNGGVEALIVRVCNGGRAPSLVLGGGAGELRLSGLLPGSREYLRAAVDHDGLPGDDERQFNLVLQRVRLPGSELVEEQEIHRRVSIDPRAPRSVTAVLAGSALVRVVGELPARRPAITVGPRGIPGYVQAGADGDDGDELTDYDLIGDAQRGTGLFALEPMAGQFSLLCVPPLSRERDLGLHTLLVALRCARRARATLIVDPPRSWDNAETALQALRQWPFRSPDALMYLPRVQTGDRLRARPEVFASCGAVAGALARAEQSRPVWSDAAGPELILRSGMRPAFEVSAAQRVALAALGVNLLQCARSPAVSGHGPRTLMPENVARPEERWLATRRLDQFIAASVLAGTRWAAHAPCASAEWGRLSRQVLEFLEGLDRDGAFIGDDAGPGYWVLCDERLNSAADGPQLGMRLLFGYAAPHAGRYATWLLVQQPDRTELRAVSLNTLAQVSPGAAEAMDAAIARGLSLEGARAV